MTMPRKPVQGMNPEELAALNNWARDFRKAMPAMHKTAQAAQAINKEMLASPVWRVVEGQPEAGQQRPADQDPWKMGGPTVNYVDHIERVGDSHESPDTEGEQS